MKDFCVNDAVLAVSGKYFGNPDVLIKKIRGVVIDNRKVEKDFLFVPIKGDRFDGHDFISAAYSAGAICCFSSRKLDIPEPYILVKDTVQAFQNLAEYYKGLFEIKTVGITGSVGKTTTKEMITSVLSKQFNTLCTFGNLNNQTGVPLTVFRIEDIHEAAVIEMGTNHFGEIANVAKVARPDYCVLTNIGEAHIEFLKSQKGILKAKTEMLEYMRPGGKVFVNGDDRWLSTLKSKRNDVISFGFGENNDIVARDVKTNGLFGSSFRCEVAGCSYEITVPSPGRHMVYNAMAGFAVGRAFGMSVDDIRAGIADYHTISGRMNIEKSGSIVILDDVYNANPESMRAALNVLQFAEGRKVCIMGDMFELGEESDKKHFDIGKYSVEKGTDLTVCIGENMKNAYEGVLSTGGNACYFATQEDFLNKIDSVIKAGDSVLIKASRGMHLENTVEELKKRSFS